MSISNEFSTKSSNLVGLNNDVDPPGKQTATQSDGMVKYESDNYTIVVTQNQQQTLITDRKTGETWKAWGDPHTENNYKPSGDFKNDLTIKLNDGTKVTLQTTGNGSNAGDTFTENVVITNGNYGLAIKGVHTGDMEYIEGNGYEFDGMAPDGNTISSAGGGLTGLVGMVNNKVETIDTTAEYTAMELDDNQAANHAAHADILNLFANGSVGGSSSTNDDIPPLMLPELSNSQPLTNKPAWLTPEVEQDVNALNDALQNTPQPLNPQVQAEAKEAQRQLNELSQAYSEGKDPKKIQQANNEFQAAMNQLIQAANDAASNCDSTTLGKAGKSWYLALAKALGKLADEGAARVEKLTKQLSGASEKDKPSAQAELAAATQQFSYMMAAMNNALTTIGQAATAMVRKG
jgi:hypothetical protein